MTSGEVEIASSGDVSQLAMTGKWSLCSVNGYIKVNIYLPERLIMEARIAEIKNFIREIPDWPKKGILFRDITPLLGNHGACCLAVEALTETFKDKKVDYVAAVEARGFIFGTVVAQTLNAGFIPVRKKGKLPGQTESVTYDLEYGTDTLQVHKDAISQKGANVLMVDDLLATGGTMSAACKLIEKIGGRIVGISFLIELTDLNGRDRLRGYDIRTVVKY